MALSLLSSVPAVAQPAVPSARPASSAVSIARWHVSTAYELPGNRVYPEGIAADPRTEDLYAASYADGTVFKMTPGRRVAKVFLAPNTDHRTTANGLKVDRSGRLWVIDSVAGVCVYDTRGGRLLARFDVVTGKSFVNDIAIARDGSAYLTDSSRQLVYRVTPRQLAQAEANGKPAVLTPRFDLSGVLEPHTSDAYTLNGIVADPSGRYLLTADMTGGDLYRLDLASGRISKVALRGGDVLHADGLEMRGTKLWVVHNADNAISRWRIGEDGYDGRLERRGADKSLQLPTTLVRERGRLYVVRSQFDKGGPWGPGTPQIPFTIAAVTGI
ncbi:MAG TPA: SMP-30/gluconolactonase/LRE family protein [Mycobacteriales bacterium]|jgi:Cu-Zn family superoxide dismutase|nr:SMP-30/gluconolactonase/LRE family protein [Mycobacteriales bacterium]